MRTQPLMRGLAHVPRVWAFDSGQTSDLGQAPAAARDVPRVDTIARPAPTYALDVSAPSCCRTCLGRLWGSHPVYRLHMDTAGLRVDAFLPQVLHAFAEKRPSWSTRIKRWLLLSPLMVKVVQGRGEHVFLPAGRIGEQEILNVLGSRNTQQTRRHNLVITSDAVLVTRNAVGWSRLDASFSKHAMVASLAEDVRFAGELWRDAQGRVHVSANSGTYKPSPQALAQALQLLRRAFPNLVVVSEKRHD